jgi:hypothetical protein
LTAAADVHDLIPEENLDWPEKVDFGVTCVNLRRSNQGIPHYSALVKDRTGKQG